MTELQSTLILFLKSALTGERYSLPQNVDPAEVFAIAVRHGVDVIAYYGALQCGIDKNCDVMREEVMRVYQSILISETQMAEVQRMMDAFEANGIDHMPLKGTLLKALYPQPEMRRMGDADILIQTEQYEAIRPIMQELGYEEKYESDHEFAWFKKPVHIELHKRLIPSYNKDYYLYYGDGWRLATPVEGCAHRYGMTAEDEMIYLFTHFAKHYRDAGIGLRHPMDLWMYRKHHPDMDEAYIRNELKQLQLLEFYENICHTLAVWFKDGPADEKTEFITQFIFSSGEYGKASVSKLSSVLKVTKTGLSAESVKRRRVFCAIFPGYTIMSKEYCFLKKLPFLLPFMWIVRGVKKVFREGKLHGFFSRRLNFTAEDVSAYQQSLNFVGLDFHFTE